MASMMPRDMRIAKVPAILVTGLELHHGDLGGRVNPGVTVNAAGSDGSSGRMILLESFFSALASCLGRAECAWWWMMFWRYCGSTDDVAAGARGSADPPMLVDVSGAMLERWRPGPPEERRFLDEAALESGGGGQPYVQLAGSQRDCSWKY